MTPAVRTLLLAPSKPSLDLNFLSGALDSRITFTRAAGPATYFNSAGVLATAGTDVPRFDYDPVTLQLGGLLIEETRTNILTNSQAINSWPTKTDTTVTDNSTASPDGAVNASLITEGAALTATMTSNIAAVAAASTITFSIFLKKLNCDIVRVIGSDAGAANGVQFWVNLTTGTITNDAIRGTATGKIVGITALPNGWYRVTTTCTMPVGSTTAQVLFNSASASGSATRVAGATYYAWGGQIEVGAFPSSYISTTAAAATRASDNLTMPIGTWYNQSAGSTVIEKTLEGWTGSNQWMFDFYDASPLTNPVRAYYAGGFNWVAGTVGTFNSAAQTNGVPFKFGMTWDGSAVKQTQNGAAVTTTVGTSTIATVLTLRIGSRSNTTFYSNAWFRRFRYWPRALTETELSSATL